MDRKNRIRTRARRFFVPAAALLVCSAAAPAQTLTHRAFEGAWTGYDVGSSAFPGNPAPFERDPTALAVADLDGDGWLDAVVANYEYAAPGGGTDGKSGFAMLFNQKNGTFGAPVHRTVSSKGCWDVVAADFDSDGDQDLAVSVSDAFFEGQSVRVYLNNGNGAFPDSRNLPVVDGPIGLSCADFNGDSSVDLAVANYSQFSPGGIISILAGDGAGGFAPQVPYAVGWRPTRLEAGDFDGDGAADLAVAHEGQQVSILMNSGDGTFGQTLVFDQLFPMQGGMYYACVALADWDQDGDLDVFYGNTRSHQPNQSPKVVHLRNEGGVFVRAPDVPLVANSAGPVDLTTGDFDGDLWPDLVAVHLSGTPGDGAHIVMNNGAGGFLPARTYPAGQATFAAATGDLDRDGRLELLTADRFSMMVTVHSGHRRGIERLEGSSPTAELNIRLDLGDVDGDGDLDAFTSTESTGFPGALLRNVGQGRFAPPVLYTHSMEYGRGASRAKLRDLDNDGDLDLLYNDAHTDFHNGYDFHVALNDGTGTFDPIVEWSINTCGNGDVDAFDLDHDGDLDVVNLEELACAGGPSGNRLFISRNRGDATFDPAYTVDISTGPHAVLGGDFNEDGWIDLVTTHWMPYGFRDFLNVHLGNGDGTFQEEIVIQVGQGPRWVISADFDGDGALDLATANSGTDGEGRETLTVLFGTGMGTFTDRTDYYAPFSPDLLGVTGLACGDDDRDGDVDLFLTTVAGGVTLYRNDGTGTFSIEPRIGLSWDPWSVMFADVTGDGVSDLVSVSSDGPSGTGRYLSVLPGNTGASVTRGNAWRLP